MCRLSSVFSLGPTLSTFRAFLDVVDLSELSDLNLSPRLDTKFPRSTMYGLSPDCCRGEYNKPFTYKTSYLPFVEVEAKSCVAPEETNSSLAKESADCQEGSPRVKLSALDPSARQEERQRQVSI